MDKKKEWTDNDRKVKREFLNKYKLNAGCEICGYKEHPVALHLDHIDPSQKKIKPSQLKKYSKASIMKELSKCRVLCANCHSVETFKNNHHMLFISNKRYG